jgi:hypothetical protein
VHVPLEYVHCRRRRRGFAILRIVAQAEDHARRAYQRLPTGWLERSHRLGGCGRRCQKPAGAIRCEARACDGGGVAAAEDADWLPLAMSQSWMVRSSLPVAEALPEGSECQADGCRGAR